MGEKKNEEKIVYEKNVDILNEKGAHLHTISISNIFAM